MGSDRLNSLWLAYVHDYMQLEALTILERWDASGHFESLLHHSCVQSITRFVNMSGVLPIKDLHVVASLFHSIISVRFICFSFFNIYF